MNWDRIQGRCKRISGTLKKQWGQLTGDDLTIIAGERDQLAGELQRLGGLARDEAEKRQLAEWECRATQAWFTTDKNCK